MQIAREAVFATPDDDITTTAVPSFCVKTRTPRGYYRLVPALENACKNLKRVGSIRYIEYTIQTNFDK